ncbi:MAG: ligase-associated DNA damage response endonuclease PdeM [Hyphomicrobiales bacterium]|nr:ligase-associated DNA damage response endonuclease PdeM [Hyphomicrobiales bacterium]
MTEPARARRVAPEGLDIEVAGVRLCLLPQGALYWPEERTLIVADLHLEKGSAFAAAGVFLPPYDSAATLLALTGLCGRHGPERVIALGDSFHDAEAPGRLAPRDAAAIASLQRGREWIWIAGNHDPAPPQGLGGEAARELAIDGLTFRHQPLSGAGAGEIAGHLHPVGRVRVKGRTIRRRCFAADGARLIVPAMGAFTGGLNVLDSAFCDLFTGPFHAWMLGEKRLYPVRRRRLLPDA